MGLETPSYQRIASEWAAKIDSGALADGDQLPTRPQMEETYGVSKQVINTALTLLLHEGYVVSRARHGTTVYRPTRVRLPLTRFEDNRQPIDSFVAAVEKQGMTASQTISVETLLNERIAEKLEVSSSTALIARKRVRSVNGIPYALADSYFVRSHVAGSPIADPSDIPTGGRHVMAKLGIPMDGKSVDHVTCRRPSSAEIESLDVAPGVYVIQHVRTSFRIDDTPVRHMVSIFPGDRWELEYVVGGKNE
ncbi:GntR family transcriptional regulator [Actinoalloteichus hoggarensis]|uniref:HTH-type transcriptional repressor YvoA n=1 Tax=Actinoalloteichus hoggarensis TaxID=1470176 RepID=A0A221W590_9PSEU|nr:GntR family transcriptional regulator [Actinoalloteichus hoggarensis]ASO21072.1 HTH-type transcriptional repressor YvoA [Actinoalloteichus hoggarensis]MBB5921003.1 GntR family transcriptional regulator [Actinoalloteichus hoggarensis]